MAKQYTPHKDFSVGRLFLGYLAYAYVESPSFATQPKDGGRGVGFSSGPIQSSAMVSSSASTVDYATNLVLLVDLPERNSSLVQASRFDKSYNLFPRKFVVVLLLTIIE